MSSNARSNQASPKAAICAIVSKNHLAHARSMMESYRKHHPKVDAYVLIYDADNEETSKLREPFHLVSATQIRHFFPDFLRFSFSYDSLELACALKPVFIRYLMDQLGVKSVIYADADILFYSPIKRIHVALSSKSI